MNPHVMVVFGTRPEAIKVAPVVRRLRADRSIDTTVVDTGQHAGLLEPVYATFGFDPDERLDVAVPGQDLTALATRTMTAVGAVIARRRPDLVLVHGDTSAAAVTALAAHYAHVEVAHLEAGLRSADLWSPWPEEANRRVIGQLASVHFAPTQRAADRLLAEGADHAAVHVTGNTVIDALLHTLDATPPALPAPVQAALDAGRRLVLVTGHRRESWESGLADTAAGIADTVRDRDDVFVWAPLHPNPIVRAAIEPAFAGLDHVLVDAPLDYPTFCRAMQVAHCIVTDSGGVQEEAPTLGTPVLVTRDTTERPEALEAGASRLIGTDRAVVRAELAALLDDDDRCRAMGRAVNPYGDGRAAERVHEVVRAVLANRAA